MAFQLPKQKANNNGSSKLADKFHGNKENKKIEEKKSAELTSIEKSKAYIESDQHVQQQIDFANSKIGKELLNKSVIKSGGNPADPAYGSPDVQAKKSAFSFFGDRFKTGGGGGDAETIRNARIQNLTGAESNVYSAEEIAAINKGRSDGSPLFEGEFGHADQGVINLNQPILDKHGKPVEETAQHEASHVGDIIQKGTEYEGITERIEKEYNYRAQKLDKDGKGVVDEEGNRVMENKTYEGTEIVTVPGMGEMLAFDDRYGEQLLIPKSDADLMNKLGEEQYQKNIQKEIAYLKKMDLVADSSEEEIKKMAENRIGTSEMEQRSYLRSITEGRARLNDARQVLRQNGIDIYNQPVTAEHMKKLKETNHLGYEQLVSKYGEKGVLEMMNTISANTGEGQGTDLDIDFDLKGATNKNINYA